MGIRTADGRIRRDPTRFLEQLHNGKVRRRPDRVPRCRCRAGQGCKQGAEPPIAVQRALLRDAELRQELHECAPPHPAASLLDWLDAGRPDGRAKVPRAQRRRRPKRRWWREGDEVLDLRQLSEPEAW